jgi:hypothetical protein
VPPHRSALALPHEHRFRRRCVVYRAAVPSGLRHARQRVRAVRGLLRELRALGPALERRDAELHAALTATQQALGETRQEVRDLREAVRLVADEEDQNRRRLATLRASPEYALPFEAADPLVSIPIPTYRNAKGLAERSLPSALAQTHRNIEIIVVGDAAPPEVEQAVRRFADPRIRFVNLERRGPYPEDPDALWFVAGTMPLNEALRIARGQWVAILNDDDEFRPDHVERLVALARERRAEVAYGKLAMHLPDGGTEELGAFPPALHQFGWQMALFHEGLRYFGFSFGAEAFRIPGDWHLCRRMLRTGVSFAMTEQVLGDYYPARLWGGPT